MFNRLAAEKSPYLRQHADNPVHWQPWGEAALAQAKAEQKPIFLSIGYSTCHWCHVMAHESFENPAVAAVLNQDFVPIKVDREERPDLDRIYMAYVQQTTGHGGWPMSVWLTPEGKPFFGGTYFSPDDRQGRAGFVTVLRAITRHWVEQRAKILKGADEVVSGLQRASLVSGQSEGRDEPTPAVPLCEVAEQAFEQGYHYFKDAHDEQWGGFGGAPKFPRASVINFLFRSAALQGGESAFGREAVHLATHTLQKMAEGGLHDHVGGGFHRYSVDEKWFVPHFEKMLYDQAQMAVNYLEAKQATGQEAFAWVARGIFAYVGRDLSSPTGGFYSAEDADSAVVLPAGHADAATKSAHLEGAFYVWSQAEIIQELADDAPFFCAHYGIKDGGNVAHDPHGEFSGKNVLMQQQSLALTARAFQLEVGAASEKLLRCLEKLRGARGRRPRPSLDDKIITAWNGLMISAFAKGHQVLGGAWSAQPEDALYLQAATRAAEFIERELYDAATGVLYRSWREGRSDIAGFAEDYAYLIQGLLDLYEAGFELRWLRWAKKLQAKMDQLFWDESRPLGGGYFNSRADDATVIVRLKEDYDGAEPAPNSVAAMNLVRLDGMLGSAAEPVATGSVNLAFAERARLITQAFQAHWSRAPHALPQMLCSLGLTLAEPRTVVLVGDPQALDFKILAAVLHERLGPRCVMLWAEGGSGQAWLATGQPHLLELPAKIKQAAAYVCADRTCQAPVTTPEALRRLLG